MISFGGQPALAAKRVALVIGNSAYQNVAPLTNPVKDAGAIAEMFKTAAFDVVESRRDVKNAELRRALRDFTEKSRDADIAVIYYAGHGLEVDGLNYLIPVDAVLERDTDAYDEAIALDRILQTIEPARLLRLVILDACRDNPFTKGMKRTLVSRALGRGLVGVEPSRPNTLVAFAAKGGSTASDGDSKNSPFTAALLSHLTTPGLELRKAFGLVRDEVMRTTGNRQEPFVYGSLGGADVALVPAQAPLVQSGNNADIRRDYELAERVGTREAWDFFVAAYPSGFYADLAKAQRNKLAAENVRLIATEKARITAEEQAKLAAEGAKTREQAKAAAQAKAAEEARLVAEKRKALEEARLAEIERARAAAQAKATADASMAALRARAADDAKAAENERVRIAEEAKVRLAAEPARAAEIRAAADKPVGSLAALTSNDRAGDAAPDRPAADEIPRLLQYELRRVGCSTGAVDGNWDAVSQKSLQAFNRHAGTKLEVKIANLDALDAVRGKTGRICPLICDRGFRADGDNCVRITCKGGFELGDDNTCERVRPARPSARARKSVLTAEPKGRPPQPAVERRPDTPATGVSKHDIAALYAQCRRQAKAEGGRGRALSFARLDGCARNGGRL